MKFVLASKNRGKLSELAAILSQFGMEICLQSDLGIDLDVEETGETFEENSLIKARAVFERTGLPSIADDSGLMVDALDGAPGVYSARFGGERCKSDSERNALLLQKLQNVPDDARGAKFVSVVTCLMQDGTKLVARGECPGVILREECGAGGFGYDPLFYIPAEKATFAQLPAARKNEISHRALALKKLKQLFYEYKESQHADQ